MDESKADITQEVSTQEQAYNRNRKKFLKLVKAVLGLLFIIVVISCAVWLIQYRRLASEKAQLKTDYDRYQQLHEQPKNP